MTKFNTNYIIFTVNGNHFQVTPEFITKWQTTNVSPGSSLNNQVKLPFVSGGQYDCTVYWGDGQSSHITSWNQLEVLHTYSTPGEKLILIFGICNGWAFNNNGDRLKLLDVMQWGDGFELGNGGGYFYGCANLTYLTASDHVKLQNTTTLAQMFANCSELLPSPTITQMDVSAIENMDSMFANASKYKDSFSNWSPIALLSAINMFGGVDLNETGSTHNYDTLLGSWASVLVQNNVVFSAGISKYSSVSGQSPRDHLTSMHDWIITDGGCLEIPSFQYNKCLINITVGSFEYRKCVVDIPTYEYEECDANNAPQTYEYEECPGYVISPNTFEYEECTIP